VIYQQRNELLESVEISETITSIRSDVFATVVQEFVPPDTVEEQWDLPASRRSSRASSSSSCRWSEWAKDDETLDAHGIAVRVVESAQKEYDAKFAPIEPDVLHHYERAVMLQSIDSHWREHLAPLDYLRQGIHLRGYAQKQPKQEYKREAFELFGGMLDSIKREVTRHLMAVQIRSQEQVEEAERRAEEAARALKNVQYQHADFSPGVGDDAAEQIPGGVAVAVREPPREQPMPVSRSTQRSAATTPAPAAPARSTSSATAGSPNIGVRLPIRT
jgi:preprotein translocase subunit SecA